MLVDEGDRRDPEAQPPRSARLGGAQDAVRHGPLDREHPAVEIPESKGSQLAALGAGVRSQAHEQQGLLGAEQRAEPDRRPRLPGKRKSSDLDVALRRPQDLPDLGEAVMQARSRTWRTPHPRKRVRLQDALGNGPRHRRTHYEPTARHRRNRYPCFLPATDRPADVPGRQSHQAAASNRIRLHGSNDRGVRDHRRLPQMRTPDVAVQQIRHRHPRPSDVTSTRVTPQSSTSSRRLLSAYSASPRTVNDRCALCPWEASKPTTTRIYHTPGDRSRIDPVPRLDRPDGAVASL
jgi:hypothetical protein